MHMVLVGYKYWIIHKFLVYACKCFYEIIFFYFVLLASFLIAKFLCYWSVRLLRVLEDVCVDVCVRMCMRACVCTYVSVCMRASL